MLEVPPEGAVEACDQGSSAAPLDGRHQVLSPWQLPSLKSKLQDRLHQAQLALLQQSEERHAIYKGGTSSQASFAEPRQQKKRATISGLPASLHLGEVSQPLLPKIMPPSLSKSKTEKSEGNLALADQNMSPKSFISRVSHTTPASTTGAKLVRASTFDGNLPSGKQTVAKKIRSEVLRGMAYMGIDWYTIQDRKKKVSLLFLVEELYYWCYAGYIVGTVLLGALMIWSLEPDGKLTWWQSVYTSAACVSQSGLAVVDWSKQAKSTYIVSFCLIILGSASLLHMVPVVLRQNSFRMQTMMGTIRRFSEEWSLPSPDGRKTPPSIPSSPLVATMRRAHSDPGMPPVQDRVESLDETTSNTEAVMLARQLSVTSQDEPAANMRHRCSRALARSHRLEYKALGKVLKIMIGYWLAVHLVGILIVFSYFKFGTGRIQDKFNKEGLKPHWHAIYLVVSSFQNNGLVITPSSVMDFEKSPLLLSTIGALILLGNTGLPIMVRLIAVLMERRARPNSENKRVLDFLLEHPRRCFTHMFPALHTMWLMLVVAALNVLGTMVILIQDGKSKAFQGLSHTETVVNALFQAVSTRTAGLNSVNIAQLSQGTTFFMLVMMYFSTTPTVVTMRFSALGDRGHELDITGRVEGVEEDMITGKNSLKSQARRYLTQDVTYLVVITFLICCFEQNNFSRSAKNMSPDSDGIYMDFSFFKVIFELISAYGTCGLSLGYEDQVMSFSGVWSEASQMLLVFTMILGRLRGLPDSIDASVRSSMPLESEEGAEEEHDFVHF